MPIKRKSIFECWFCMIECDSRGVSLGLNTIFTRSIERSFILKRNSIEKILILVRIVSLRKCEKCGKDCSGFGVYKGLTGMQLCCWVCGVPALEVGFGMKEETQKVAGMTGMRNILGSISGYNIRNDVERINLRRTGDSLRDLGR